MKTLLCLLLLLLTSDVEAAQPESADRPNVVVIHVDDLGYGDVGAYGAELVETPQMDRLAREGRRFTDAHSASAVCSPSRYALMTGQYPSRVDLWGALFLRDTLRVDTSRLTVADVMQEAGYATAAIGKWHLGFGDTYPVDWNAPLRPGPLELGFDYYFGVPVLNSHPPFVYVENDRVLGLTSDDPLVYDRPARTREFDEKFGLEQIGGCEPCHRLYEDRRVGTTLKDRAARWIREHSDEPFFLYFAPPQIHHPFTAAPQFIGTSRAGRYGDWIHELDWMVGELLRALDEEDVADGTLVILTSDNGGMFNRGGQTAWEAGHRLNGDLLGMKFGAWEGGHRVPFIVRWPGRIPAGTVSEALISNVDLLGTLAALVGRPLAPDEGPDSFNLLPALTETPSTPVRDHLIISPFSQEHLSIRRGRWMYIPAQGEGGFGGTEIGQHAFAGAAATKLTGQVNSDIENGAIRPDAPPMQLYNLEADPLQRVNVYEQHPDVAAELADLLQQIIRERSSSRDG